MKDVFEPMANFGGEVFEPMNFDGEYSEFALDPLTASLELGKASAELGSSALKFGTSIVDAKAKRKEAEAKIADIGGKRVVEKKACEDNKSFKKFLDRKKRNNQIRDCQTLVDRRLDKDEAEQYLIQQEMMAIEKMKIGSQSNPNISSQSNPTEEPKSDKFLGMPKVVGISVTIGVSLILIGLTTYLILKRK